MNTYSRTARRARLRLILIACIALAVLAGIVTAGLASLGDGDDSSTSEPSDSQSSPSASSSSDPEAMTPGRARQIELLTPERQENGVSRGFPDDAMGATSAAAYFLEEFAWMDDAQARQQMEEITSANSPESIDAAVSEVRENRESVDLDPSGGLSAGLTVTTRVEAACGRKIATNDEGADVVQVWLVYDRYATGPDGQPMGAPLEDQVENFIFTWEDGEWMLTEEQRYQDQGFTPASYNPDSPEAYAVGWMRVTHE